MAAKETGAQSAEHVRTSVVIPVYNTEDYLAECLDSVLAQTQHDIEVILVDDGSTDGSLEIERAYAARDPRVRVIQQANLRQGTARNRGLREARGEFVYFMDSDDLIVPDLFETCYAACQADDLDFVTFDTIGFLESPDNPRPDLFPEVKDRRDSVSPDICSGTEFWTANFNAGRMPFICWLEYFRRSFLLENDLEFVEGIYFEDNDWIVRIYLAARRLRYLPRAMHYYRERPGSNVHSGFKQALAESCLDVHDILCRMASHETDPVRIDMIQDVNKVVNQRFRQFSELSPTDTFMQETCDFACKTMEQAHAEEERGTLRRMHLQTLVNLMAGVREWPSFALPFTGEDFAALFFPGLPQGLAHMHVGIYGTGRVCSILLRIIDFSRAHVTFLETEPSATGELAGHPVVCVAEAGDTEIDTVLVASTKFTDAMSDNVRRHLGNQMPVYPVSRDILAFGWLVNADAAYDGGLLPL